MPQLYVKLGSDSTILVEVPDNCSGIHLQRFLKTKAFNDYSGIPGINLEDIQFDHCNQKMPLDDSFYSSIKPARLFSLFLPKK